MVVTWKESEQPRTRQMNPDKKKRDFSIACVHLANLLSRPLLPPSSFKQLHCFEVAAQHIFLKVEPIAEHRGVDAAEVGGHLRLSLHQIG